MPEIKLFQENENKKYIKFENSEFSIDNFEQKRQKGVNDSYICELIRNDYAEEFIIYVNRTNISLLSKIKQSIFETNPLLIKKEASLIEYAAFYGSIQIFNYLKLNNVGLTSSLWIYAIHSNNPEMIEILEYNKVKPPNSTYEECLKESIKCHHNDIANYFIQESNDFFSKCNKNICSYGFRFYNFEFISDNFDNEYIFYFACQYDYFKLVKLLLETKKISLNKKIILKQKKIF